MNYKLDDNRTRIKTNSLVIGDFFVFCLDEDETLFVKTDKGLLNLNTYSYINDRTEDVYVLDMVEVPVFEFKVQK